MSEITDGRITMRRVRAYAAMGVALLASLMLAIPAHAATSNAHTPHGVRVIHHREGSAASAFSLGGSNIMYNANSGKVAEVYHSQTTEGAQVDQWTYNGTLTQKWSFNFQFYDGAGNQVVTIVNANSGKCMETYHSQLTDGATVDQWPCNGTATQEWDMVTAPDGNTNFINWNSVINNVIPAEYLEVYHSQLGDGAKVDQYHYNGTKTQEWHP